MSGAHAAGRQWTTRIVGGDFTAVNGAPASNLAIFDGFVWAELGGGADELVFALEPHDGSLAVGGTFTLLNGSLLARAGSDNRDT